MNGIEVQSSLYTLARDNQERNGLSNLSLVHADVRQFAADEGFQLIVMNPPYFVSGSGKASADQERRAARHEVNGTLRDLLGASRRLLARGGRIRLIYPAESLPYLMESGRTAGLKLARLRPVYSFANAAAKLVLADFRKGGRSELVMAPPLVIWARRDCYSPEVLRLLEGDFSSPGQDDTP